MMHGPMNVKFFEYVFSFHPHCKIWEVLCLLVRTETAIFSHRVLVKENAQQGLYTLIMLIPAILPVGLQRAASRQHRRCFISQAVNTV